MTDNGWEVSAKDEFSSTYEVWKAFSKTYAYNNNWLSGSAPSTSSPQWLKIKYPSAQVIKSYVIRARDNSSPRFPTAWKLQGSNNDSDWTDIGSEQTQTEWVPNQNKSFDVSSNTTAYQYYRLRITGARESASLSNSDYVAIGHWFLLTETSGSTVHTKYTRYTYTPPASTITANVLRVAGGGGGSGTRGGGGGAGGLLYSENVSLSGTKSIVVGNGGIGYEGTQQSIENGYDTVFTGLTTSIGGGHGGGNDAIIPTPGGSGGGGSARIAAVGTGAAGTSGQGNAGGNGSTGDDFNGGGGGGAGGVGGNSGGVGGVGLDYSSVFGTTYGVSGFFAGGGGGGNSSGGNTGGNGGGGSGSNGHGTKHTGGGGAGIGNGSSTSGDGGSGIVIIKKEGATNPPTLNFDGYNKLTIDNVDTVETATIKKDGAAFATTTSNTVYIRNAGTYTAEVKGSGAYVTEVSKVVSGDITNNPSSNFSKTLKILSDHDGHDNYRHIDMCDDGSRMAIGSPTKGYDGSNGSSVKGVMYIYKNTGGVWSLEYTDESSSYHNFGRVPTFNSTGTSLFVVEYYNDSPGSGAFDGRIRVYDYDSSSSSWSNTSTVNGSQGEALGMQSISCNDAGTVFAVSRNAGQAQSGGYKIYSRPSTSSTSWTNDVNRGHYYDVTNKQFGISLSMDGSGTRLLIGGFYGKIHESNYDSGTGSWSTPTQVLSKTANFGYEIEIARDLNTRAAIRGRNTASGDDGIYDRDSSGNWTQTYAFELESTNSESKVMRMNRSGTRVILGNGKYDSWNGRISIYDLSGGTWSRTQTILNPNTGDLSGFGLGLAMARDDANTIGVAAPSDNEAGTDWGAVYVYDNITERLTYDNYNKITLNQLNYEDTTEVTYYSNTYNLGTAKTMYVKDEGEYVFKISGTDKYVESNVHVSSVDLAGAPTKPISFDGYNKLTLIDAGSNVSANVTYFSNTYELGSANVLYINGAGTYDLEMSGSNVFALSSNVTGTISSFDPSSEWTKVIQMGVKHIISADVYSNGVTGTKSNWLNGVGTYNTASDDNYILTWDRTSVKKFLWRGRDGAWEILFSNDVLDNFTSYWSSDRHYLPVISGKGTVNLDVAGSVDVSTITHIEVFGYGHSTAVYPQMFFTNNGNHSGRVGNISWIENGNSGWSGDNVWGTNHQGFEVLVSTSDTAGHLIDPVLSPSLTFDNFNKLTIANVDSDATSNIDFFSNTYEMGSRKELIINDAGTYHANIYSSNTLALVKKEVTGTIGPETTLSETSIAKQFIYDENGYTDAMFSEGSETQCIRLSSDGLAMALGDSNYSSNNGRLYYYERSSISDTFTKTHTFDAVSSELEFGASVDMNAAKTRIAISGTGVALTINTGRVYIYDRASTSASWPSSPTATITPPASTIRNFGHTVNMSDDGLTMIISGDAANSTANRGGVYVYEYAITAPSASTISFTSGVFTNNSSYYEKGPTTATTVLYQRRTALYGLAEGYGLLLERQSDGTTKAYCNSPSTENLTPDQLSIDGGPFSDSVILISGKVLEGQYYSGVTAFKFTVDSTHLFSQVPEWSKTFQVTQGISRFGFKVAMNKTGTRFIAGGTNTAYYVYHKVSGTWSSTVQLTGAIGYHCGMSPDGDTVAVGMVQYSSNLGRVAVYKYSGSSWGSVVYIDTTVGSGTYQIGNTPVFNNDGTLLVSGCSAYNSYMGCFEMWKYESGSWVFKKQFLNPTVKTGHGSDTGEFFGGYLSMDYAGTSLIVSNPGNDVQGADYGRVVLYGAGSPPSLTFDGYNKLTAPVLDASFTATRLSDWDNSNQSKTIVANSGDWPESTAGITEHNVLQNGDKSYQKTNGGTGRDSAQLFTTVISGDWANASHGASGTHSPMTWGYKFTTGAKKVGQMILTQPPNASHTAGNVTIKYWDGSAMVTVSNQSPTGMSSQSYNSSTTFTFDSVSAQYWQIDCYRGSSNGTTYTGIHGWQLLSGQDPVTTVITKGSDSYDIGTASSIYIDAAGTYDAQAKNSNTFVIKTSKQVINTPAPKQDYTNIWAGEYGGMVVDSDGKLYTWGNDGNNQSGRGAQDRTPTHLSTISDPVSNVWVDGAPGRTRIVKTSTDKWYMWGMNLDKYKIFGQTGDQTAPVDVTSDFTTYFGAQGTSDTTRIIKVVMSSSACSALAADGKVWSWGVDGNRNELGKNTTNGTTATPFKNTTDGSTELSNITDIRSLHYGKLALDSNGDVWQWGTIGTGNTGYATKQTGLDSITIIGIGAGYFTAYAWDAAGTIYSIGQGTEGQLGNGASSDQHSTWQTVTTLQGKTIYAIYGAGYSVFAHTSDGVYACGQGTNGRLGMGNSDDLNVFTKSTALSALSIYKLDFGHGPGYIITTDGKGYALGYDYLNSIPTPLSGDKNVPTEASSLTNLSLAPSPPPGITYDNANKLSIEGVTAPSTNLTVGTNTYDIGSAKVVFIKDQGTYKFHTNDGDQALIMSNEVSSTPSGTTYLYNVYSNPSTRVSNYSTANTSKAQVSGNGTWPVSSFMATHNVLNNGDKAYAKTDGGSSRDAAQLFDTISSAWGEASHGSNGTHSPMSWGYEFTSGAKMINKMILYQPPNTHPAGNVTIKYWDGTSMTTVSNQSPIGMTSEVDLSSTEFTFDAVSSQYWQIDCYRHSTQTTGYTGLSEWEIYSAATSLTLSGTTPSQVYDNTKTITVSNVPSTQTGITGKIYKGATAYTIHATEPTSNVIIKNTGSYVSVFTTSNIAYLTNTVNVNATPTTTSDDNTIEDEGFIPGSTAVPDETTTDAPSVTLDVAATTTEDPILDLDFTATLPRTLKRYNGVTNFEYRCAV